MDLVLDIVILLFMILSLIWGYKRGFIKSVARPVRFFASIATAFWLASPIAQGFLEPAIKTPVTNQIRDYLVDNCPNITPETATEELPTLLRVAASIMDVDIATLSPVDTISEIVDSLASPVIHLISVILTFILVYFVAKLVFSFVLSILSSMFNDGVLGLPNKLFGCVISFLFAIVISWAFVVVFDFAINSSFFADMEWAQKFEGGIIYKFFVKNSPVDLLLSF